MADSLGSHAPRSPFRAWQAFLWSMQGLRATWSVESSFRLEVYLFVLLAPLAAWLGATASKRAILIGSLMLVLSWNCSTPRSKRSSTAGAPSTDELAGRAKDMGSAAVFLCRHERGGLLGLDLLGPRLMG